MNLSANFYDLVQILALGSFCRPVSGFYAAQASRCYQLAPHCFPKSPSLTTPHYTSSEKSKSQKTTLLNTQVKRHFIF